MARETTAQIVPIAIEQYGNRFVINAGSPILPVKFQTDNSLTQHLRDVLSTLKWEIWEHEGLTSRESLRSSPNGSFADEIVARCPYGYDFSIDDVKRTCYHTKDTSPDEAFEYLKILQRKCTEKIIEVDKIVQRSRQMNTQEKTGYPSIDKPWLKYYSEKALHGEIPKCTMYEYIYDHNKSHLDGIALQYFNKKITYKKLFENIRKTADAFWAQGIRKGDTVTIMSLNTPETIYCIYALNYIGAVANMVYMTLSEEEIVETVRNTDSKMFIFLDVAAEKVRNAVVDMEKISVLAISPTDSFGFLVQKFSALKSKSNTNGFLNWNDFLKAGEHQKAQQAFYRENELAVIVYTSGTTGIPKGVMLSNDSLNAVAWQYEKSGMKFTRGETFLTLMPPFLSIGLSLNVHLPLSLGTTSIMIVNPEKFIEEYKKYKPNHCVSGPVIIRKLVQHLSGNMSYCITMAGGGESLSLDEENNLNETLKNHHSEAKYLTGYGMTEFAATVTTSMNHVYKAGTLGIPLCKVNVKVINPDNGEMLKYNETGELCFCTPSHMLGYLDNEEETKKICDRDEENRLWIHTGDLGFVDEEGFVHFVGRIKRIYITQDADGTVYKLFPQRIEETITEYPEVDMCAVVVELDAQNIATAIACVKRTAESQTNNNFLTGLQQYCKEKLPVHLVPKQIIELDEIPLTQSGKIDYKTLDKVSGKKTIRIL